MFSERFSMAHCLQRAITKAKLSGRQFFDQIPINRTYFYNVLANDRHDLTDMVKRSYAVGRKTKNDVFIAAVKEMAEFVKEYCALKLFKGKKKDDEPQLLYELHLPTKREMWFAYRRWATYKTKSPETYPRRVARIEKLLTNYRPEMMPEGVTGFLSYSSFYYHFPDDVRLAEPEYFSCKICSVGWNWINKQLRLKLLHNKESHPEREEIHVCKDDAECWTSYYDSSEGKQEIEDGLNTYRAHKKIVSDQRLMYNLKRDSLVRRNSDYDAIVTIDFSPYCNAYRRQNTMTDMMYSKQALQVVIYTRSANPAYHKYQHAHQVYFSYDTNDCYFTIVALMYLFANEPNLRNKRRILLTSDGCHKHFKSVHVLAIVTVLLKRRFGFDALHWNFFASYHGKSGCDANAAHVKFTLKKFALTSDESIQTIEQFVQIVNDHCPTTNAYGMNYIGHKDYRLKKMIKPPAELSRYHHFRWDKGRTKYGGYKLVCSKTAVTAASGDNKTFSVHFMFPEIVDKIMDANPGDWVVPNKLLAEKMWEKYNQLEKRKDGEEEAKKKFDAKDKYLDKDVLVAHENTQGRMVGGKLLKDWHRGKVVEVTWETYKEDPHYTPTNRKGEKIDEGVLLKVRYYEDEESQQEEQSRKKMKRTEKNAKSPKTGTQNPKKMTNYPKKILGLDVYDVPLDAGVKLFKERKRTKASNSNK